MPTRNNVIYFLGILLFLFSIFFLFLSYGFSPEIPLTERPVIKFIVLLVIMTIIYLCSVYNRLSSSNATRVLYFIFIVGVLIRVVMIFSVPVLEDDFNRYLWDGAVTASGENPYVYSPGEVGAENFEKQKLVILKNKAGKYFENINHPGLKTVYPPVAQLVFAVSYKLGPFNLTALKIVLLFFDLVTFFLLLYSLRVLCLSSLNILIYWWNPLLINEIFNSCHMEVMAFPFVLLAVFLAARNKIITSLLSLALAVGVKIWPLLLFPLILRSFFKSFLDILKPALIFAIFCGLIFLPLIIYNLNSSSGFIAYSRSWENNSSMFRILLYLFEILLKGLDIHAGYAQKYTRVFIGFVTVSWVLYQTYKSDGSKADIYKRCLFLIAGLFLISPTQFPWYYTWLLPFLAIVPRFSLLLLTTTLSLYYLRYYLEPRGMLDVFNCYIVWIEFVPVWVLLIVESRGKKVLSNF